MKNFYDMSEAEQVERLQTLAKTGLQHWGLEEFDIELIKHRENTVFSVTTPAGERYAMRIHRHLYHSDEALRSELKWMEALNDVGVFTPEVLPSLDGELFKIVQVDEVPEPRQCDLLSWVNGELLGSIEEGSEESTEEKCAKFETIGELAAKVHNQAASWALPEGFERHAWDVDGLVGDRPFWGRFWELPALTEQQRELLQCARNRVREVLIEFGEGGDRYSLIHADLLPENLIVEGDSIKLIDFDDSGFGWHLFEFATCLFFFLDDESFDEMLAAMVRGYRKYRELPDDHLALMPVFFMARAFTYLGWLYTRSETDTAREMTPVIVAGACEMAEDLLNRGQI